MPEIKISGRMLLLGRKRRLMTQTALGVESKLPQTLISRLENSDIGVLEEGQLEAIEVALRLPRSWFLPHEEETFKQP